MLLVNTSYCTLFNDSYSQRYFWVLGRKLHFQHGCPKFSILMSLKFSLTHLPPPPPSHSPPENANKATRLAQRSQGKKRPSLYHFPPSLENGSSKNGSTCRVLFTEYLQWPPPHLICIGKPPLLLISTETPRAQTAVLEHQLL